MSNNNALTLKKIERCLAVVEEELQLHYQNKPAEGDIQTLKAIYLELSYMKKNMSPQKYRPSYEYILRDSMWDYMRLSEILLDAYYSYMRIQE